MSPPAMSRTGHRIAGLLSALAAVVAACCSTSCSATPPGPTSGADASVDRAVTDARADGTATTDAAPLDGNVAPADAPASDAIADAGPTKSIRGWTVCDGVTDDAVGAAAAFAAAKNGAFTLLVDCPVFLHVGTDIARPIFIEDGTTVSFAGNGLFIVDNVLLPTFVLANTTLVTMNGWQVKYVGGLPIQPKALPGYYEDGGLVAAPGDDPPGGGFNDVRLTQWLTQNRGIVFDPSKGRVGAHWVGPTNTSSIFYIIGSTSQVTVSGMNLFVPPSAGGNQFIPMCFSMTMGYLSNQTVTADTPLTGTYWALPSHLTFTNIDIDGAYMGWQGGGQNLSFTNIHSHRYGDLQDADGGSVGGVGKWFAPPHLFYLNYAQTAPDGGTGDPAFFNQNLQLKDVVDDGTRVGVARDTSLDAGLSGYALSLKIGGVSSSVDSYKSYRPDGLLDCLPSDGLTISHVTATYNSAFLNDLFPGIRFPGTGYTQVVFDDVSLMDVADSSVVPPMGSATQASNAGITATGVTLTLNQWAGTGGILGPVPTIYGTGNDLTVDYVLENGPSAVEARWLDTASWQLGASPSSLHAGAQTTLTWSSRNASACAAGGGWSGSVGATGSQAVTLPTAGSQVFTLACTGVRAMAGWRLRRPSQ
jgi:hypothetical protein